ncbi:hypothetical protein Tb09.244.0370 [Trypanosoma brucei brucei TREU927]|uniref:Uncharacterized protein n=1 Tax=Trypanosoma brucei brucei (strain 927/4 GUTat10.1) TaxID=185431 RepID=Q38CN6_TRYB2|nr:hypothetical protein Tb09.244.0370 [Trypanosoma brucei brucei TREU927]EAN77434.1 hypothetical protein Tb09.244.0370 [Trypanosoma brucei brucei TREU927]
MTTLHAALFVTAVLKATPITKGTGLHNHETGLNTSYDTATYLHKIADNAKNTISIKLSELKAATAPTNKLFLLSGSLRQLLTMAAQLVAQKMLTDVQTAAQEIANQITDILQGIAAVSRLAVTQETFESLNHFTVADKNVRTANTPITGSHLKIDVTLSDPQH